MNRNILFLGVAVFLLVAGAVTAAPGIRVSPEQFNFGTLPQHSTVKSIFWIHSIGDDTLRITRVIPGCGCTKAPLEKDVLPPGDSTRLEIIFDSKSFRGQISKSPRIETNAGKPDAVVTFSAMVTPHPDSTRPLTISPYKLDITQFGERQRSEATFKITNHSDRELAVTPISLPADIALVDLPKRIAAHATVPVRVSLRELGMTTEFERSITFELNDAAKSRYTVPVKRQLQKPAAISTTTPPTPASGQ